jgi:hypothetical protein
MFAGCVALRVGFNVVTTFGLGTSSPWLARVNSAGSWAYILIVMAWVYQAWAGIPRAHRGTMTPWRAVLTLWIPVYNLYWAFAMNMALCDTLDGILASAGSDRRAPRTLGIVANAAWLSYSVVIEVVTVADRPTAVLGTAMALAMNALWFAYMLLCDRAREEVARLGADPSALGAPRLSRIQRKKVPHPVTAIAVSIIAIVGFLGCWQLAQPVERKPASHSTGTQPR